MSVAGEAAMLLRMARWALALARHDSHRACRDGPEPRPNAPFGATWLLRRQRSFRYHQCISARLREEIACRGQPARDNMIFRCRLLSVSDPAGSRRASL